MERIDLIVAYRYNRDTYSDKEVVALWTIICEVKERADVLAL